MHHARNIFSRWHWPLFLLGLALVGNVAAADVAIPFKNSNLEEGSDNRPAAWQQGVPVDTVQQIWDRTTAHGGKGSLCLKKTARRYFPIAEWRQTIAVDPSDKPRKVRVKCWVKAEQVTKAVVDVGWQAGKPGHAWASYIGQKQSTDPVATHDWKLCDQTVEVPAHATELEIAFQIYGPGSVWFDDLEVAWVE